MVRPTVGWLEWLRVGAIVGVVVLHVLTPVAFAYDRLATHTWTWINIADSASRWCVPVLIMVSGALHLGRRDAPAWDGRTLARRIVRVGVPLIVWSVFYWWFGNAVRGRTTTPEEFAGLFVHGDSHFHLYFLFVIIGLYAITPVLRPFVDRISDRTLGWFAMAAFSYAVLLRIFLGVDLSHSTTSVDLFTRFLGYYLAGAWLFRVQLPPVARIAPLFAIAAIAATAVGTVAVIELSGARHQTLLYSYQSPLTVLAALAVFATARLYLPDAPRWVVALAGLTFGTYLIHPVVLWYVAEAVPLAHGPLPMALAFMVQTLVTIGLALVATAILSRIPWLSASVGVLPPGSGDRASPP